MTGRGSGGYPAEPALAQAGAWTGNGGQAGGGYNGNGTAPPAGYNGNGSLPPAPAGYNGNGTPPPGYNGAGAPAGTGGYGTVPPAGTGGWAPPGAPGNWDGASTQPGAGGWIRNGSAVPAPEANGTGMANGTGDWNGTGARPSRGRAAGSGRRAARKQRVQTRSIFSELADLAAIPRSAYALEHESDGAMCLIRTDEGFEVFSAADGARHEVRSFDDEEAAYFYLFGVLAAEAVRSGSLAPPR